MRKASISLHFLGLSAMIGAGLLLVAGCAVQNGGAQKASVYRKKSAAPAPAPAAAPQPTTPAEPAAPVSTPPVAPAPVEAAGY